MNSLLVSRVETCCTLWQGAVACPCQDGGNEPTDRDRKRKTMTTRTVKFSHGTAKDAALKIPVGPYCIDDIVSLIRESYLDYAFRDGCGLMSDEVVTSSIGQSNFFAGALGGYESRLSADMFKLVKCYAKDDCAQAMAVARYRMPDATDSEVYLRASKNEVLDRNTRQFLADAANL